MYFLKEKWPWDHVGKCAPRGDCGGLGAPRKPGLPWNYPKEQRECKQFRTSSSISHVYTLVAGSWDPESIFPKKFKQMDTPPTWSPPTQTWRILSLQPSQEAGTCSIFGKVFLWEASPHGFPWGQQSPAVSAGKVHGGHRKRNDGPVYLDPNFLHMSTPGCLDFPPARPRPSHVLFTWQGCSDDEWEDVYKYPEGPGDAGG